MVKPRHCIGIDLGTTNSCVAVWLKDQSIVQIITTAAGDRTVPSVVYYGRGCTVGLEAKQ